mmetsp:Transcript_119390/g.207272  ORF Transcript_119390/g.207272 Transcript_119390/m.207272 type:complete len:137 (+) Transcript_119390:42-452(+)
MAQSDEQRAAAIVQQFRLFDQNADGSIDRAEFEMILQTLAPDVWTPDKISQMLNDVDTNRDGTIDVEEFVQWAFGGDLNRDAFDQAVQELESPTTVWGQCYKESLEEEARRAQRKKEKKKKKREERERKEREEMGL